jgi:PEP-CTERM motif
MLEYAAQPSHDGAKWPLRREAEAPLTESYMTLLRMGRMAGTGARLLTAAALALALGAVEARANHIFTLSDVTFDDGTLATGMFTTNNALTSLVTFDITTTNGAIAGFEYTPGTAGSSSTSLPGIIVLEPSSLDHIIQLTFDGNLTLTGAPILIGQFDSFEQDSAGTHRAVVGGSVVAAGAVPEPSSLALAGTAVLAGLGLWARRRRRA